MALCGKRERFALAKLVLEGEVLSSVGLTDFEISPCRFAEAVSYHDASHVGSALDGRERSCELVEILVVLQFAQSFVQQGVFGGSMGKFAII